MRPDCSDGPAFAEVVPTTLFHAEPFRWRVASQRHERCLAAVRSRRSSWRPAEERLSLPAPARWSPRRGRKRREEVRELVAAALGEELDDAGHPLEVAARRIHEDLVVMERRNGAWVMTAGVVCFPTRWRPSEKIGRTMAAIHEPVPRYDDIATAVDRFFDRLQPGRLAWRANWSVVGDAALRLEADDRQALARFPRSRP